MPWFESSKEKQLRKIVEDKMNKCLTRPEKYQESLRMLDSYTKASNQKVIEMIVDHVKQTIKDENIEPQRKLRALQMLVDLMKSKNKALGKYVSKKILKRLKILGSHNKLADIENRGAHIFSGTKKSQQKHGKEFLKVLLSALEDWGKNWPKTADGPFKEFQAVYNQLIMNNVTFPKEKPKITQNIKKQERTSVSPPPPSKMTEIKQKIQKKGQSQLSNKRKDYFQGLIEISITLQQILEENKEYDEMWPIIKEIITQLCTKIKEGDQILTIMLSENEQNPQLESVLSSNGSFVAGIQKNVSIVDKNNAQYVKFRAKYLNSLKSKIQTFSSLIKAKPVSKMVESSAIKQPTPEPKVQQESQNPKIKQANRYDSTSHLQQQLKMGLVIPKKEDFASNSHNSDHQSRYNSISRNRASIEFPKDSERGSKQLSNKDVKEEPVKPSQVEEKKSIHEQSRNQKNKSSNPAQMSKISEKFIESEHGFGAYDGQSKGKTDNEGFDDFSIQKSKDEHDHSNSNFFKEMEKNQNNPKENQVINTRAPRNKPKQESTQNFFDSSIKQKANSSSNLDGFDSNSKSLQRKSSQIKKQSQQINKSSGDFAFDTFKDPNAIQKAVTILRNQQQQQEEQENPTNPFDEANPFQKTNRFDESNPHENKSNSSNPFSDKKSVSRDENSVNMSKKEINFQEVLNFSKKSIKAMENPFTEISKRSEESNRSRSEADFSRGPSQNPFATTNPFDEQAKDNSISRNRSFRQANVPIQKSRTQRIMQDPFQTDKSQDLSQDQSKMNTAQKQNANNFLRESVKGFDFDDFGSVSDQNKSRRDSFDYRASGKFYETSKKEEKSNDWGNNSDFFNSKSKEQITPHVEVSQNRQSLEIQNKQIPQQIPQKKQFGFSDFDWQKNSSQRSSQKGEQIRKSSDNFFDSRLAPSEKSQKTKKEDKKKEEFGFSDFDFEKQKSVLSKSSQNPFGQFEKSKESNGNLSIRKKGDTQNEGFGWDDIGKELAQNNNSNVNQSRYEYSQSADKQKNEFEPQIINKKPTSQKNVWQDENKSKQSKQSIPQWPDQMKKNNDSSYVKSNSELNEQSRKIQILPQGQPPISSIRDPQHNQQKLTKNSAAATPFQKKEQPWSYQLSPQTHSLPKSSRYNSGDNQALVSKKEELKFINEVNRKKLQNLAVLKNKLLRVREKYQEQLKQVQVAKDQRNDYRKMLISIEQGNETKQRQIQEMIKRIAKGENIKSQILEKEKLLYEFVKQEKRSLNTFKNTEQGEIEQPKQVNKWQRFNSNFQKLKNEQINTSQQKNNQYRMYASKRSSEMENFIRPQQKSIYF